MKLNNRSFGAVLDNLLYITKQKKSSLANYLGYDVSYINKWVNSKILPSSRRANEVCRDISNFIIESLNENTRKHLVDYFELDKDDDDFLYEFIKDTLSNIYLESSNLKGNQNIHKISVSQEYYNSNSEVKPAFLQKIIREEVEFNVNSSLDLDIIIAVNLFDINYKDKVSLVNMKKYFYELCKSVDVNISFLLGLNGENKEEILNSLLTINILSSYPKLNFDLYNCNVSNNTAFFVMYLYF